MALFRIFPLFTPVAVRHEMVQTNADTSKLKRQTQKSLQLQSFASNFSPQGIFQKPRFSDLKTCPQAALTSQHEGRGFDSDLSVWNLHALPVPAWVHAGHSGLPPTVQVGGHEAERLLLSVGGQLTLLGVTRLRLHTAATGCSNRHER